MRIRYACPVGILLLLCTFMAGQLPAHAQQPDSKPPQFSDTVAESAMRRLRNGLVARNADGVLAAFDPDKMPDYSIFSDQIRTFLDNWENVRVYYQIAEVNQTRCGNENCGTAQVQFEIEAEDVQGQLPPMHRSAQLQLSFARGNKGWRIVNLTPREFF